MPGRYARVCTAKGEYWQVHGVTGSADGGRQLERGA
jgi:hypothetical protein